ncbi:MAG: hypothetical protein RBT41_02595 [Clostridia bacterium]|jgi:hypothetical protein|nr:hypothetical protein [Clostridia bacterium]
MKRFLLILLVLFLVVSLFGCNAAPAPEPPPQDETGAAEEITGLVENFGSRLQKVSLLAPEDTVKKSLEEQYGSLVAPGLLKKWQEDPEEAPGRVASSPWPERIEVLSIEKLTDSAYEVKGEIIEVTSVEMEKGGAAAKRPLTLIVEKSESNWLIVSAELGSYSLNEAAAYENTQYGFRFALPESWQGYTIVTEKWEGLGIGSDQAVENGPLLSLRHPDWTEPSPRQDIPILIFTTAQWASLEQEKFHIGAAPIGPSELDRNSEYVFALPARYNYAFPAGFEEVEEILQSNPLQADDTLLK